MAGDAGLVPFVVPLTGKLIYRATKQDIITRDFTDISNMRYTDTTPEAIKGMVAATATLEGFTSSAPRSMFQFVKHTPSEFHLLVQVFNVGETVSVVYKCNDVPPTFAAGFEGFGDELIVNGTLAKGPDGWSSGFGMGPSIVIDTTGGTMNIVAAGVVYQQSLWCKVGQTYRVTYTVVSIVGSVRFSLGGVNGTLRTTAGTFTEDIVALSPEGLFALTFASTGAGVNTVIDNISVISATGWWADTSGAGTGRFSFAPNDYLSYCNGKETVLWGGNEQKVAGFFVQPLYLHYQLDDFTEQARNDLSDADNLVVLSSFAPGGIDANTSLLLHFDGPTVQDDSPAPTATERISNPDFAGSATGWTLGAAWQYSLNSIWKFADGTSSATASGAAALTNGVIYKVKIRIFSGDGSGIIGTVTPYLNGTAGTAITAAGVHIQYITAGAAGGVLLTPSNTARFYVDYVSVRPVAAAGKVVTVTGATQVPADEAGTRYGEGNQIRELLGYAQFDGVNDLMTVPRTSAFDFTGGTFCVEATVAFILGSYPASKQVFYGHATDANNYAQLYFSYDAGTGCFTMGVYVYNGGAAVVDFSAVLPVKDNELHHYAWAENGAAWRLYCDGELIASISSAGRFLYYTGTPTIGCHNLAGGSLWFAGRVDELRVSNASRYTSASIDAIYPFSHDDNVCQFYVGALQPIKGIKFYVNYANAVSSSNGMKVYYWNGKRWTRCTNIVDGTAIDQVCLAQTGWVTFDDTAALSQVRSHAERFVHWYRVMFDGFNNALPTKLTQVTVKASPQLINDLWDGQLNVAHDVIVNRGGTYLNVTVNVSQEEYLSTNGGTYAKLGQLATGTDNLFIGSLVPLQGIYFGLAEGKVNSTAATIMSIFYWDGVAWRKLAHLDNTEVSETSLSTSNFVSWSASEVDNQKKLRIQRGPILHYYRINFSATLSGGAPDDIRLFYVGTVPASKTIEGHEFSMLADDRLWLGCGENKNAVKCSARFTANVFNGEDSTEMSFGDAAKLVGSAVMYSRFSSQLRNIKLFFKERSVWAVTGDSPENFEKFMVFEYDGCPAPATITSVMANFNGVIRPIIIWQGNHGIYMFDGSDVVTLHADIDRIFTDGLMQQTYLSRGTAFYDPAFNEWHWITFSSGANGLVTTEFVLDLKRMKWFRIQRHDVYETPPVAYHAFNLYCGCIAKDTGGTVYTLGMLRSGALVALETGHELLDHSFKCYLKTGPAPLSEDDPTAQTKIRFIQVLSASIDATGADITVTHTGDTRTSTAWTLRHNMVTKGGDITDDVKSHNLGDYVFHAFKLETHSPATDSGNLFRPLMICGMMKVVRQNTNKGAL